MRSVERALARWVVLAAGALAAGLAAASPELARKHGCLGCHAVDQKVVGPSFTDVAKRYRNTPAAVEMVAKNMRSGLKGAWGDMPMPAQQHLTDAELETLARWVLAAGK